MIKHISDDHDQELGRDEKKDLEKELSVPEEIRKSWTFKCTICKIDFQTKKSIDKHIENVHDGQGWVNTADDKRKSAWIAKCNRLVQI